MRDCEIIRDLMPLYADRVASPQSGAAVKKHLHECAECRKYYAENFRPARMADNAAARQNNDGLPDFTDLSRRLRRRKMFVGSAALAAAIGVAAGSVLIAMSYGKGIGRALKDVIKTGEDGTEVN